MLENGVMFNVLCVSIINLEGGKNKHNLEAVFENIGHHECAMNLTYVLKSKIFNI